MLSVTTYLIRRGVPLHCCDFTERAVLVTLPHCIVGKKWQRLLSHEREQRLRLEEMVEQLARQHSQLEHQVSKFVPIVL